MAFCEQCGSELSDGARFCAACGAAVDAPAPGGSPGTHGVGEPVRDGRGTPGTVGTIVRDADGSYHWVFEFGLFTNPTILFTIWKVFGGVALGLFVLFGVMQVAEGLSDVSELLDLLRFDAIILAVIMGLGLVGYLVYALMQGGTYCVVFTMDEEGILHRQLPSQYKKAEVVSALNVLVGLASGNVAQVGIGLTSMRDSMRSTFANVRSIEGIRRRGVIKVNEPFAKNQVYVDPKDYDFVYGFICERCPNAQIRS